MDKASEAILALKPVTLRYKKELDPAGIPQFGLVAEEVEKINPDLVARDEQGKSYTVRYEAVNAMLLNEFLKEHRKVERLEAALSAVNARLAEQDS
jgi:Chaperone of endosialidase